MNDKTDLLVERVPRSECSVVGRSVGIVDDDYAYPLILEYV